MTEPKKFEVQLLRYLLTATVVPSVLLIMTLWYYDASINLIALLILSLGCLIIFCASELYRKITFQFRTLSNLLEAITQGDYSLRGRQHSEDADNALGQLISQINSLTDTLIAQRYAATESQLLVLKIIQHIDVAIIAINEQQQITLLNPAAENLLKVSEQSVINKPLADINANELLNAESHQVTELCFAGKSGKYQIITDQYREHGHQHHLFFITDVNLLLRSEERKAWQNLVRVLSHEINNSLSPIASIANTLSGFSQQIASEELAQSFNEGLAVIAERASSLGKFIQSYRQLSHLPVPNKRQCSITDLLSKLPPLFKRTITILYRQPISALIDPVLIEQVLINLVKNADEASIANDTPIDIKCTSQQNSLQISIIDNGHGVSSHANLFTPFYTTKKQGNGIGLVLCRQIIEAHNGQLTLSNRIDNPGAVAKINLPIE